MLVPPSPKFQLKEVGLPVLWLVNDTARGALPEVAEGDKAAAGAEVGGGGGGGGVVTVMVLVVLFEPPALVAVSLTV